MKFAKQPETFEVNVSLESPTNTVSKHGALLPQTVRGIICGASNCGKTNLMFSLLTDPNGLKYENVYVFSKSLQQPKYEMLGEIYKSIPEIGYYTFDSSDSVPDPSEARKNSVMIFDDVACDKQEQMKAYFSMGRHKGVDTVYLIQTYTRLPKHLLRDNANLIILFKQDELNLKHVYNDHVNTDMSFETFKDLCSTCWNKGRYNFVVINKDCELNKGRYRCGLDTYVTDI